MPFDPALPAADSPGLVVSDPPPQAEMQALATRLDAMLTELQRQP